FNRLVNASLSRRRVLRALDRADRRLHKRLNCGQQTLLLIFEMVVEGRPRNPGDFAEIADLGRLVTILRRKGNHGAHQSLALAAEGVLRSVSPPWPHLLGTKIGGIPPRRADHVRLNISRYANIARPVFSE